MNLKKIVSIILLAIGIIIILIAFFFMGNGYESYQIQEINLHIKSVSTYKRSILFLLIIIYIMK